MPSHRHHIELLAPAKTADIGIEAVNHGADAIYIGGPSFGARGNASNEVADIARLVKHAHRYHARVFTTLNTILRDDELEPARQMIWQLYDAGVDALIVQDMGLLELDLPPIQLHASTQTDIRTVEKAKFLQDVGFSQIVLARELTLPQIQEIADATHCAIEFFHPRRLVRGLQRPVLHQPRPHWPQRQPGRLLPGLPPALQRERWRWPGRGV
jgi:collagenase-like PrtC family protease